MAIEHLKERLGERFALDYNRLLYDVASTYFEGLAAKNDLARRGHSRAHRPDCPPVCIALVITREGMPLGDEVFAGHRVDVDCHRSRRSWGRWRRATGARSASG